MLSDQSTRVHAPTRAFQSKKYAAHVQSFQTTNSDKLGLRGPSLVLLHVRCTRAVPIEEKGLAIAGRDSESSTPLRALFPPSIQRKSLRGRCLTVNTNPAS